MRRLSPKMFQKQWKLGCLSHIDFKKRELEISDGSLFCVTEKQIKVPRIIGYKQLPNGYSQVLFSRKKYPAKDYTIGLWFEDIDDTIAWFVALKKELKKLGYRTSFGRKLNVKSKNV